MVITPELKESYCKYINRILSSRINERDTEAYQEKHHIIPKCQNGSNDSDNLIYLYAQEHYYAHKLLALENPNNNSLQLAWWNMCQCTQNGERKYDISADDYAEARILAANANSNIRTGTTFSEEHKKHLCGHGKPVINITTGETYLSAKEAGEKTGISSGRIGDCCNGKRGSAGRDISTGEPYIWRFQGEESKDFGFYSFHLYKKIFCIETKEEYVSAREASRETGVAKSTILADCKGNRSRQKIKRLHFSYVQ